jgi:3-hydroxyacyl-[acyl-carrier-protein] dehydratase
MKTKENILKLLPYTAPFLFVDHIAEVREDYIRGTYYLKPQLDFYQGHFRNRPVTPGVILTEIMVQIGLACLGIYLTRETFDDRPFPFALTHTEIDFLKPVFPGETVTVTASREYFRMGKLKCKAAMTNGLNELVCEGRIAGIQTVGS